MLRKNVFRPLEDSSIDCNEERFLEKRIMNGVVEKWEPDSNSVEFLILKEPIPQVIAFVEKFLHQTQPEPALKLWDYALNELEFALCPASTKYHLCQPGGLLRHSCLVMTNMIKLLDAFPAFGINKSEAIFSAIFHDLGKTGFGKDNPRYTLKVESIGDKTEYDYNNGVIAMSIPSLSLYHISKFLLVPPHVYQAIMYHDGQYVPESHWVKQKEHPLTVLLHHADYLAGRMEVGWS